MRSSSTTTAQPWMGPSTSSSASAQAGPLLEPPGHICVDRRSRAPKRERPIIRCNIVAWRHPGSSSERKEELRRCTSNDAPP